MISHIDAVVQFSFNIWLALSRWCISHRKKAKQVVETWETVFKSAPPEQQVSFLYLANDILQNSRRKGTEFVSEFWKVLPTALKGVYVSGAENCRKVASRLVISFIAFSLPSFSLSSVPCYWNCETTTFYLLQLHFYHMPMVLYLWLTLRWWCGRCFFQYSECIKLAPLPLFTSYYFCLWIVYHRIRSWIVLFYDLSHYVIGSFLSRDSNGWDFVHFVFLFVRYLWTSLFFLTWACTNFKLACLRRDMWIKSHKL